MEKQKIILSDNITEALEGAIAELKHDKLFMLTDETTLQLCAPVVKSIADRAGMITIPAGDTNKGLESMSHVWGELQRMGATRHSLMVNLGGGMVTDLGGFAASTFKRGIKFINIPTTLLSMVDASVGGKTGVNFGGLKNEIGVFNNADYVILDTVFLKTMDDENLCSGYAEMLKRMVAESVAVKERIVLEDPLEHGIRKALNVGHTMGHAFESFAMKRTPILHGYAVAYGIICELYLSAKKTGFPTDKLHQTVRYIREHYGKLSFTCDDYDELLALMKHDKKNVAGTINFTLLGGIGDILINQTATREEITEALDFYREG